MTLNFLPSIGRLDPGGHLVHAIGYNGHGVAQATAVGDLLADLITGRPNEWLDVVARPAPTLPPEPLLWLVARGALGLFGAIDPSPTAKSAPPPDGDRGGLGDGSQPTTSTPYGANFGSMVTTGPPRRSAAAMMKRSKGSRWWWGRSAAAVHSPESRGTSVSP